MTLVVPSVKELLESKLELREAMPQPSVAVGSGHFTGTAHPALLPCTVMSTGRPVSTGAAPSSCNVKVCTHEELSPDDGSVAVHVLLMVCSPAHDPVDIT